jgi:2-polyprenyl-3-methyl-5-hydroxy-6-metoxy-1,4-benzoquinol methylase
MEDVSLCPVCGQNKFDPYLKAIDHTITKEKFELTKCRSCQLIITNPRPTQSEIGKYYASNEYISHSGKSKTTIDKVYLLARNFTLRWKYQLLKKNLPINSNILDYGCGTGEFLNYLKKKHLNVAGIEPTKMAREKANALLGNRVVENLNNLKDQTFNAITLWHVLEHVHEINDTITSLKKILAKDGYLYIAVPNQNSHDSNRYNNYWAAIDVPRHLWHFTQETMSLLLKKNGLIVESIKPMKLDSFYVSLLSEQYKNPNQPKIISGIKAFLEGSVSNYAARKNNDYSSLIYIVKSE